MNILRQTLPPAPPGIARLPVDVRGYPIPWFVGYPDGKPDFREVDALKYLSACRDSLCWICGGPLGLRKVFVFGPMCAIQGISGEPPSHPACAEYAARVCPFLVLPHAKRRTANLPEPLAATNPNMVHANPGITALWTTTRYRLTFAEDQTPILHLGEISDLKWYAEGEPAPLSKSAPALRAAYLGLRQRGLYDPAALGRAFARVLRATTERREAPELRLLLQKAERLADAELRAELIRLVAAARQEHGTIEQCGSQASAPARAWLNRELWGYQKH